LPRKPIRSYPFASVYNIIVGILGGVKQSRHKNQALQLWPEDCSFLLLLQFGAMVDAMLVHPVNSETRESHHPMAEEPATKTSLPSARGSPPLRASISPLSNLWNRLSSKSKSSKLVPSRRRLRSLDGWPAGPLPPDPFIVRRRWPAQTTSRRSEIRPASCSLQLRHSTTRLFFVPSLSAAIPTTVPP